MRSSGVVNRQGQFHNEANNLASQVSESMHTLGNSRVRREKLSDTQQHQMGELTIQTQKEIQHCQETAVVIEHRRYQGTGCRMQS